MSQHTGLHKNSLNLMGEKYLNESHWPMRQIRLLECICSLVFVNIVCFSVNVFLITHSL